MQNVKLKLKTLPLTRDPAMSCVKSGISVKKLNAGDRLFFSGTIYTARDQAHKRLSEALKKGKRPPVNLADQVIYYCGPTPAPKNKAIGSCGPTTSSRMDEFTPVLLKNGLLGMIGKGMRSAKAKEAIKKYKGVYFLTYAGCGALLSQYVKKAKAVAYKDLGAEAIYKLEVKNFPLIVGIDSKGRNIYTKRKTQNAKRKVGGYGT